MRDGHASRFENVGGDGSPAFPVDELLVPLGDESGERAAQTFFYEEPLTTVLSHGTHSATVIVTRTRAKRRPVPRSFSDGVLQAHIPSDRLTVAGLSTILVHSLNSKGGADS